MSSNVSSSSSEEDISDTVEVTKFSKLEAVLDVKKKSNKEDTASLTSESSSSEQSEVKDVSPADESDDNKSKISDLKVSKDSLFDEEVTPLGSSESSADSVESVPDDLKVSFNETVVVFKKSARSLKAEFLDKADSDVQVVPTSQSRPAESKRKLDSDDESSKLIKRNIKISGFRKTLRFFRREIRNFFTNNPIEQLFRDKKLDKQSLVEADLQLPDLTDILTLKSSEVSPEGSEQTLYAPSPSTGAIPKVRQPATGAKPKVKSPKIAVVKPKVKSPTKAQKPIIISPFIGGMPIVISPSTGARSKISATSSGTRSKTIPTESSIQSSLTEALSDSGASTKRQSDTTSPRLSALLSKKVESTPLPIPLEPEIKVEAPGLIHSVGRPGAESQPPPRPSGDGVIIAGFRITPEGWLIPPRFMTDTMIITHQSIPGRIEALEELVKRNGTVDEICESLIDEFNYIFHDLRETEAVLGRELFGDELQPPHEEPDPETGEFSIKYHMIDFYNLIIRRINTVRSWTQDLYNWCTSRIMDTSLIKETLDALLEAEDQFDAYHSIRTWFGKHNVPLDMQYFGDTYRLVHCEVQIWILIYLLYFLRNFIEHTYGRTNDGPSDDPKFPSGNDSKEKK